MAETKTYAGAVSSAVLQGVTAGAWAAAAGLSPAKRRLVRTGLTVAGVGMGIVQARRGQPDEPRLLDSPVLVRDVLDREVPEPAEPERKLPPPSVLVALAASTGLAVGGRLLEKRWLARLVRAGHTRPHRALGIRMGLLTAGTALASDLIALAEARRGEQDHAG